MIALLRFTLFLFSMIAIGISVFCMFGAIQQLIHSTHREICVLFLFLCEGMGGLVLFFGSVFGLTRLCE
jgi:hypothetical protein